MDYKVFVAPDFSKIYSNISGDNKKGVLVINLDEDSPEMVAFLQKILASAQLDLHADCLLLTAKSEEKFPPLVPFLKENAIKIVLVFGFSPTDLGMNINTPQYFITPFNNYSFLFSPKLSVINASADHKRGLWNCIKGLFMD